MADQLPPRRIRMDKMTPAELAITEAMTKVEEMPPDTRLTDAVILLGQARDLVADFVDAQRLGPSVSELLGGAETEITVVSGGRSKALTQGGRDG